MDGVYHIFPTLITRDSTLDADETKYSSNKTKQVYNVYWH